MDSYFNSHLLTTQLMLEQQARNRIVMNWLDDAPSEPSEPTHEGEDMIEVGKVVIREAVSHQYDSTPEEAVTVSMNENGIMLSVSRKYGMADMNPEQTLELGQILLKTAEVQPEYAEEANRLAEETKNLATKYRDMISGLGLEIERDIVDVRGTFTVVDSAGKALG